MSRIGKKPIAVPSGVKIQHDAGLRTVNVEGPKGKLSFTYHPMVSVEMNDADNEIVCKIPEAQHHFGPAKAQWGTTRSRIENMVTGVTQGYTRQLEIIGVGWNAKAMGKTLQLNIGYCHPVDLPVPEGVEVKVENNVITISGYDKQVVGQFAAVVRDQRRPEPYNGKGIKYVDEIIIRKQGKAFGA